MSRMNFVFDLQMFAEDDEHVDDNVNEGVVEEKAGNASGSEEENFEVPDELAGIPEDIAREIVANLHHHQHEWLCGVYFGNIPVCNAECRY